ncbi:MAG: hypothetical protein A2V81_00080 [Candidatus Abawacabacteria bacterium RBG_16_42_10]|uniref:Uncharacterized protein n=1 Tax=Candidatus Abawacabacteria bacterium RBG_16_42_10 TaxID=1817814 RepID=A0A1F4XL61_9BACT|nr:MAG: hypothetical protein A2V81_00080 [Candidatus Abawacabacteria bacterium RBG_16_42_10]
MKKKHIAPISVSITLFTGIFLFTGYGFWAAFSQTEESVTPHFWVIVRDDIHSAIAPLIDRYITDITPILQSRFPDIVVEKKPVALNPSEPINRQAYSVSATLEQGFRNTGLVGAFLVGMPIPEVKNKGKNETSLLPYSDFDQKYFSFHQADNIFVSEETTIGDQIKSEIFVGLLPDIGGSFSTYFDRNHDYYTGAAIYARSIFLSDQIHDDVFWENLGSALLSPTGSDQFNLAAYDDAIRSSERNWSETLKTTRRWEQTTSPTSVAVEARFGQWYEEPALGTLRNVLPAIAEYFLELPETGNPTEISTQENTFGQFLFDLGVFSDPLAINHRFFTKNPADESSDAQCTGIGDIPNSDTLPELTTMREQWNSMQLWITSIPRGSLLGMSPESNQILINGISAGRYFVIRAGDLVRTSSGEPVTIKTIVFDPSVIKKELAIPATGFNHPGLRGGSGVPSWETVEITGEQINELLVWHYFLNHNDYYVYFSKNRLPPLNQFAAFPDTYEIVYNNLANTVSERLNRSCFVSRSPETRSLVTLFTGHTSLTSSLADSAILEEISSGRSLAVITLSSDQESLAPSLENIRNADYTGLKDPPLFVSFASGQVLGKALQPGLNEVVNLLGDPCIYLRP